MRFLSELEAGRANISVVRLESVARALGASAGTLLLEAEQGNDGPALPPRISLLGLRGAGKTAIGRRLAAHLDVPFFELDALIEAAAGLPLADLFALHGETYYRRLESDALRRFLDEYPRGVLATGGGIVTNEEAFRLLCRETFAVWLRAHPDDHWNRVVRQGDSRPMAGRPRARAELRRLLATREPLYARARLQLDTTGLTVAECARRLSRVFGGQLSPAPSGNAGGGR